MSRSQLGFHVASDFRRGGSAVENISFRDSSLAPTASVASRSSRRRTQRVAGKGFFPFSSKGVTPVDRRTQGLLPRQRSLVAASQQAEAIAQTLRDLFHRGGARAPRALDRRRNLEVPADFCDGGSVRVVTRNAGCAAMARSANRCTASNCGGVRLRPPGGYRGRRAPASDSSSRPRRAAAPARCKDLRCGPACGTNFAGSARAFDDMLAIVVASSSPGPSPPSSAPRRPGGPFLLDAEGVHCRLATIRASAIAASSTDHTPSG